METWIRSRPYFQHQTYSSKDIGNQYHGKKGKGLRGKPRVWPAMVVKSSSEKVQLQKDLEIREKLLTLTASKKGN